MLVSNLKIISYKLERLSLSTKAYFRNSYINSLDTSETGKHNSSAISIELENSKVFMHFLQHMQSVLKIKISSEINYKACMYILKDIQSMMKMNISNVIYKNH